ncbi:MAG TPA: 50S ribosomal protein L15 [Pseudomonadales bacterium]|nr:50S ribosomal protein L15 [Anaerolineae bacterium]MCP5332288.1 50S ribosomal protein L15 [Pseudomonadales bacterium]HMY96190.1 50S ribosomal protein L15 [Pseudomonadales bacterium]HND26579.1 50S ribosomal protein L15 [Pseudomonadales bacterium]HNF07878.1 50S ribosomal protein L15 [Pseudomonadales bacterium]
MGNLLSLNELSPGLGSKTGKKRVGRGIGSGLGKTCGRGHKGQRARKSGNVKAGFEGGQMPLQRRLPKFGFTSQISLRTAEVRLQELNALPQEVIEVDFSTLKKFGIVRKDMKRAKLIGASGFDRAITLRGIMVSAGALAAIEAAGGRLDS